MAPLQVARRSLGILLAYAPHVEQKMRGRLVSPCLALRVIREWPCLAIAVRQAVGDAVSRGASPLSLLASAQIMT